MHQRDKEMGWEEREIEGQEGEERGERRGNGQSYIVRDELRKNSDEKKRRRGEMKKRRKDSEIVDFMTGLRTAASKQ